MATAGIAQFSFPTEIHFGPGARRLVARHLAAHGVRRPLVVTDRGLTGLPILGDFVAGLEALDPFVYAGVHGNPVPAQVEAGVASYREHAADAVIGFGGGAALDVAKAIALMSCHEGSILEYAWDHPKARPVENALPYLVALPTTSGTGSEVGRSAVISQPASGVKRIIFSPALLARAVFADPELTFALPAAVTAATGMDALTHNVESYLSPAYHPICDGIALEGARLAARSLARAVEHPRELAARSDMMMASMMGAIAFQKDLGAVHSCAHALGTVMDMHHGLANGIMIDYVMRFNAEAAPERLGELARVCGAGATAGDFVDWLSALKARIGIPAGLAARGVAESHVPRLAEVALADTCHRTNPRPCTGADFERIFTAALQENRVVPWNPCA